MNNVIIEVATSVAANLAITLIAVLGAWLAAQIGKSQKLANISAAVEELTAAAENTVLELKQVMVDEMKQAAADGKLTKDEIATLGDLLWEETLQKVSDASIGVLRAANIDINAIIKGAGEAMIARMKSAA
ncbi:MAG: hypothetical protein IIZ17_01460 [Eubacteriaceae bacterium]|nr:hypothetical protein [Eubacteriaceae bacterium]